MKRLQDTAACGGRSRRDKRGGSNSRSMQVSIRGFKHALSEMTPGNLTVRAQKDGKDEFSVFGQFVNGFLDKLYGILKAVRKNKSPC